MTLLGAGFPSGHFQARDFLRLDPQGGGGGGGVPKYPFLPAPLRGRVVPCRSVAGPSLGWNSKSFGQKYSGS